MEISLRHDASIHVCMSGKKLKRICVYRHLRVARSHRTSAVFIEYVNVCMYVHTLCLNTDGSCVCVYMQFVHATCECVFSWVCIMCAYTEQRCFSHCVMVFGFLF